VANYAYIRVRVSPGATKAKRVEGFEPILKRCVLKALDKRWKVELADFEDVGPTWTVTLPGTGLPLPEANKRMMAPDQDIGFTVSINDRCVAFRHVPNHFETWAQGRVEEELAEYYGRGVFFDATSRTKAPKAREYRVGKTFQQYMARNFKKPLSAEDKTYLERYKMSAPEGHWSDDPKAWVIVKDD
jgi:hypothetical protein